MKKKTELKKNQEKRVEGKKNTRKKENQKYLYLMTSLAKARFAWMVIAVVLAGYGLIVSFALSSLALSKQVELIPYNLSLAEKKVKIGGDSVDPTYMTYLAEADIKLPLIWGPGNIDQQKERFLARTCPSLYSKAKLQLTEEFDRYKKLRYSQTFNIMETSFNRSGGNIWIEIKGGLVRFEAGKVVYNKEQKYRLDYKRGSSGVFCVSGFELLKRKTAEKEG